MELSVKIGISILVIVVLYFIFMNDTTIFYVDADKATQDKAAQDKAAQDKAAQDKAAQDKAAQDKATAVQAALVKATIYTKFNNKNCVFGQIGDPNSNNSNYNYLGLQNSYEDCINAANSNTNSKNFKAVTYHEPNFGDDVWKNRCYGIVNNVSVDQSNVTCGIKQ